jgi:hypothetical protein
MLPYTITVITIVDSSSALVIAITTAKTSIIISALIMPGVALH